MMGGYDFGGIGFLWPMIQIVILVVGIYLVVQFIKNLSGHDYSSRNAIELLDSRYVQGVFSDEEYEKMKRTLKSKK